MKSTLAVFLVVTFAVAPAAQAVDQDVQIQYVTSPTVIQASGPHTDLSWSCFINSYDRNLNRLFADRFHPLEIMNWNLRSSASLPGHAADTANRALSQSIVYGAREVTIDLPVMAWLAEHQSWLSDLFRNSLGSVDEEDLAPTTLSYRPAERSWWQELADRGDVCYGIRPFKTNPYAFLSWAIKDGGQTVVLSHIRYHYENFADHNFELAMSVPLARRCSVDLGTSYQFGRHEDQKRLTIKLSRGFLAGGILNVGFELQQHPRLLVGMAVPW